MTLGAFGGVAGVFAVFFFAEVPKVRNDIMVKVPIIGQHFIKEIPASDNVSGLRLLLFMLEKRVRVAKCTGSVTGHGKVLVGGIMQDMEFYWRVSGGCGGCGGGFSGGHPNSNSENLKCELQSKDLACTQSLTFLGRPEAKWRSPSQDIFLTLSSLTFRVLKRLTCNSHSKCQSS